MPGAWGKVSAVLFDMDGVLCNSEEPSRRAAVDVFAEMGVDVTVDDFMPFTGTGDFSLCATSTVRSEMQSARFLTTIPSYMLVSLKLLRPLRCY